MKRATRLCAILWVLALPTAGEAQDPHYSQFFTAPFTVNPAYTGVFNGKMRFMANYRQQWANAISPFTTATAAFDTKIGSNELNKQNPFNLGVQFMNDRSMRGTLNGNAVSLTASYHATLDNSGRTSLGAGLMGTYMNRRVDLSALTFDEQFSSGGFIQGLPTGEAALQQLKPYVTVGAGLLFLYNEPESGTFFELGASGFHFGKPAQTVLKDENQYVPIRYSLQASLQKFLGDRTVLNLRCLYQSQAAVEYLLGGGTLGVMFGGDGANTIGGGLFYRSMDAIIPYMYVEYDQLMFGVSYDATLSSLRQSVRSPRSMEFSLQWRFGNKHSDN